jgi:NAD(P)-dependent dehydrogenase (short-subunit alcohol dehydrogenase family)
MGSGRLITMAAGIALVTGGSRGIGAASARALASAGWDVAISFRSSQAEADRVVQECQATGVRGLAVQGDVSVEADVDRLFARVADDLGPLTALVNNAGVMFTPSRVADMSADRITEVLATNVVGAFLVAGRAVRAMSRDQGGPGGVIVNVSSRAAQLGAAGENVDYAASKAAIDIFTRGLAAEVAGEGIRVVGVRPGLIDTDIHPPGRLERIGSTPPLGRPGTADEVAAVIAFLISDGASYVTGTTLDVSGGR